MPLSFNNNFGNKTLNVFLIIVLLVLAFLIVFNVKNNSRNRPEQLKLRCPPESLILNKGGMYDSNVWGGGSSTSNMILLKKKGSSYEVLLGQLKEHGNRLQFPGGFKQDGDENLEQTALRGASEMTGLDFLSPFYGKGIANLNIFKDTPDTQRANCFIILNKDVKFEAYKNTANEELDSSFTKCPSRVKWVPMKDIISNPTIKSDNGNDIAVPFYIKRALSEAEKLL